jgi:hypothetical protein
MQIQFPNQARSRLKALMTVRHGVQLLPLPLDRFVRWKHIHSGTYNPTSISDQHGNWMRIIYKFYIQNAPASLTYTAYEMFSYTSAGLVTAKRLRINDADLNSTYTYDNEGARTSMKYPDAYNASLQPVTGQTFNFAFDAMKRLTTMTEQASGQAWVSGVQFNAAGQWTQLTTPAGLETRQYL